MASTTADDKNNKYC